MKIWRHTLLVVGSSLIAARALAISPLPSTLGVDQLQAGQKAVVRTVFQGSKVEEFEAEIVGVMRMGRAGGDMIIARATSERVIKSGVAMGMSGSPVYVDGKLIGALSSGWPFSREPVFGVTPIGEMLQVLENTSPAGEAGTAGPSGIETGGASVGVSFGEYRWDDDERDPFDARPEGPAPATATGLRPAPGAAPFATGPTRLTLPLACGGLHPAALEIARGWLQPLGLAAVPGGQATPKLTPDTIEPGSAVAIDLMRGDLQISAIGTVTWRDGDRVLIFGHPFFQSGDVRLPLASAEIATVIASDYFSFKMGVRSQDAGVVTQDRRAAVAGRLGGTPHLLPYSVEVTQPGRAPQRFRFESIEDRALAPMLMAIGALNGVLESGGTGGNQTMAWTLKLHRAGVPPLTLSDVVTSEAPVSDLAGALLAPMRFLFNNPYERLTLDSVAVSIHVEAGRELWTLRSARILQSSVRPGGRVRVEAELERWRGGRERREFSIQVPQEVPEGQYTLMVGSGPEVARYEALHLPGRFRPTSLDDAWRRLSTLRSSEGLYAVFYASAPEVTSEGRDYPELPLSAMALMASGQRVGEPVRRGDLAKLDETRLAIDGVTRGSLLLSVTVDPKGP